MPQDIKLVLVNPEIPANTGNIVRLCAVTGVELHVIEPCGFSWDERSLKRAGLDYWSHCHLERHLTFAHLEERWPRANYYFLSAHARRSLFSASIQAGDVLVLGCESAGLSRRFLDKNDRGRHTWTLPMPGRGRSLNLASAAAVAVYEALRQLGRLEG